ncbi:MAG: cadherin domain-containing protein [Cyclobacteriaceae bacterium]
MIKKRKILSGIILIFLTLLSFQMKAQTPPDISLIFYLDEHSKNGTLVGTVSATDPDGDVLTYTITSGNDDNAFSLNSSTGDITVADETQLDYETITFYTLMVNADDGNGGTTTAEITINLVNILGLESADGIKAYPNPVTDILFINMKGIGSNHVALTVYSIGGQLVPVNSVYRTDSIIEIDCKKLPSGIYILKMTGDDQTSYQRRIYVN